MFKHTEYTDNDLYEFFVEKTVNQDGYVLGYSKNGQPKLYIVQDILPLDTDFDHIDWMDYIFE